MSEQLTPINLANNDTFLNLITLANNIVDKLATVVVTANNSANGGVTIGNSYISGIFGASTIVAGSSIRGGSISNNANLVVSSNLSMNSNTVFVHGDTIVNSTVIVANSIIVNNATIYNFGLSSISMGNVYVSTFSTNTSGTGTQTIDYFSKALYRSAEYLLSYKSTSVNTFTTTKMLLIFNGNNTFSTEYSILTTNASANLGVFSATSNSTSVILQITPTSNLVLSGYRITLAT